jgi:hypothetical protein
MTCCLGTTDSEYRSYKKMCFGFLILLGVVRVSVNVDSILILSSFFHTCKSV